MKFTVITNTNEIEKTIKSFDVIEKEINNCKDHDDFVIVNNNPAINDAIYLQGMLSDKNKYTLEIRFEHENDFSQYGIEEVTKTACLDIFRQYYKGNLPDLNQWDNITRYVRQYYYNSEIALNQENVHPSFNDYFKDDFYYSVSEYYSPFGNDPGFDALMSAEKFLKEDDTNSFYLINFIDEIIIDDHHYKVTDENLHLVIYNFQTIVAVGFTNLKVNGFIMEDVKGKTLSSLKTLDQLESHENYKTMISDLTKVKAVTYA